MSTTAEPSPALATLNTAQKLWNLWQSRTLISSVLAVVFVYPELFYRLSLMLCVQFAIIAPRIPFDLADRYKLAVGTCACFCF